MEQKQLDEIDESYFGDEFIDEPEVKVEKVKKPKKKAEKAKSGKEVAKEASKEDSKNVEEQAKPKDAVKVDDVKDEKVEVPKTTFSEEISQPKTEPINPWANEEESGAFQEASTWKAITGILVILLIFSIFTQGFSFAEGTPTGAATDVSLQDAEAKAVNFVNTNLLQAPFTAKVTSSDDVGSLYLVTLDVAGQSVDSYLTKDGKLFFPQGFDVNVPLTDDSPADLKSDKAMEIEVKDDLIELDAEDDKKKDSTSDSSATTDKSADTTKDKADTGSDPVVKQPETTPVVTPPAEVTPPPTPSKTVPVAIEGKKWFFSPDNVKVSKGDTIKFSVSAVGLDFTFAIPDLGVKEEISGKKTFEVVASKTGKFDFSCSSCEDWRGMQGTLVVE